MATTRHLGLDLGGTNVKQAIVEHDGPAWSVLDRSQVPTRYAADANDVPAGIVVQLGEMARTAIAEWGPIASIGIGLPGLTGPVTGREQYMVNIPGPWAGLPVAEPVAAATGVPTHLINDARAFGLAELRLGAGRGASSMVGFTLGTGIGGVIVVGGRVYLGRDGTAGELGHQTIDPDGPLCNCGNRGCLAAFARADRICAACGTTTVEEAVRLAREGEPRALGGLRQVGRHLGIGIANMITIMAPDVVVIGGGVAAAGELLFEPIRDEIARRVLMTAVDRVSLVQAELGTWAGSIGAAIHGAERTAEA